MEDIDPFNTVREEVESSIVNLKSLYDQWMGKINSGSSSSTQSSKRELNQLELNMTELIENIDMDIVDLEQTIQIVESNEQKFNISQSEIQKRKQFVSYARNTIMNIQKIIQEPKKKQPAFSDPLTSSSYSNNPRIDNEHRHQQLLLQEQNEAMDDVLGTVYNMKEIARTMNQELDDQAGLLQEFEEDVDNTALNLSSARRRLDRIVDSNDYSSCTLLCIIILLFIIFLIVLAL
jgi:syntaxin 6